MKWKIGFKLFIGGRMCKSICSTVMSLVFAISIPTQAATYGGGSGTAEDPYQIWTPQQLNTIGVNPADWNKHFILMADIDMSAYTGMQYHIIAPSYGTPFRGMFEGNGHVIRNLTFTTTEFNYPVGLFGYIDNARIRNLGLTNVSLSGKSYAGGLAAENHDGIITNCYASGSVQGHWGVGGLVGYNMGSLRNCYATVSTNGSSNVGGLVGENWEGMLASCYATGSVTGENSVGGLVGDNSETLINCYATGTVSGHSEIGGLVGVNESGSITACYATGLVSGTGSNIGGLVGEQDLYGTQGSVTASFWDIQTSKRTTSDGGTGKTMAEMKTLGTFTNGGWDFSETDGDPADWRMPDNDYPRLIWKRYGGGIGTSEDPYQIWMPLQMNTIGTISDDWGAHFKLMADIDMSIYSGLQVNRIGNLKKDFTGIFEGNDHVIRNLNYSAPPDEDSVGLFGYTENAIIRNLGIENITIAIDDSKGWRMGGLIGSNGGSIIDCYLTGSIMCQNSGFSYVGGLVGQNNAVITSCYTRVSIDGDMNVGDLVGTNNNTGIISSCQAAGSVESPGMFSNVGGLVGENYGSISNCSADSLCSGGWGVGGLVGSNGEGGIITSCRADSAVNGTGTVGNSMGGLVGENRSSVTYSFATGSVGGTGSRIGGLVGDNSDGSTIADCYATGAVRGDTYVGGLVGSNSGSVISSYSTGLLSGSKFFVGGLIGSNTWGFINGCFWNIQASTMTQGVASGSSIGLTGKTTAQMKTRSTFTSAGCDFATVWTICEGTNYPRFIWQIPSGDFDCPDGVDIEDLEYFVERWLMNNCTSANDYCGEADIDRSGIVNLADFSIFAVDWLKDLE